MAEKSYKRRQFMVRPKFQLKYAGIMLLLVLMCAAVTGYTIYYSAWLYLGEKLANVYPQGRLIAIFNAVNMRVAVNLVFISALCVGVAIFASHKIAGPIYRMIRYLDSAAGGNYSERLKLRKGDELQDLAEAINRLVEKLDSEKKRLSEPGAASAKENA